MAKMCTKFNFIPICTYLCGVCHIYCSCSNYFGPNEFGYHLYLNLCQVHWICIGSLSHLQGRCYHHVLIGFKLEWLWTLIIYITQCYLGNEYLSHAYFSSFQPCVGCFLAWVPLLQFIWFLQNIFIENVSKLGWLHFKGNIYNHFHDSPIPIMLI